MVILIIISLFVIVLLIYKMDHRDKEQVLAKEKEESDQAKKKLDDTMEELRLEQISFLKEQNELYKQEFYAWEKRFCSNGETVYNIAGINFRNNVELRGAFKGRLQAEDWNAYDKYAVAIYGGRKKLGYIPREYSQQVSEMLATKQLMNTCYGCIYQQFEIQDDYSSNIDPKSFLVGRIVLCYDDKSTEKHGGE